MLTIQHLSFQYGSIPVLSDLSFSVQKGELCALFGPNGSGKTTLFRCCLKFLPVCSGVIQVDSEDISTKKIEDLAKIIAYVPQEHKPPFPFLVREIVLMGRTPYINGFFGIKREDKEISYHAMKKIGILPIADLPYNQLSGGQRQMVLMARALAQDAPLLLLDEPTSALDFQNQIRVWNIMRDIVSEGKTILACTHDPNHVAWFCDNVVVLSDHQIIAQGTPRQVMQADLLNQLYQNICLVHDCEGIPVIIPLSATQHRGPDGGGLVK